MKVTRERDLRGSKYPIVRLNNMNRLSFSFPAARALSLYTSVIRERQRRNRMQVLRFSVSFRQRGKRLIGEGREMLASSFLLSLVYLSAESFSTGVDIDDDGTTR